MILNYVRIRNIMLLCESLCRNHMNFHVVPVHLDMDFCCAKKGLELYISNPSFDFACFRSASKKTPEWGRKMAMVVVERERKGDLGSRRKENLCWYSMRLLIFALPFTFRA